MFGGGFWGTPIGNDDYLTKEREPPPPPTKLEFPDYVPNFRPHPLTAELSSRLRYKLCHSKSFLDISDTDLESLNICLEKNVSVSSLVPDQRFATRPLPFDTDLQAMLDEISVENEDAFREVLRMAPLPGRKKPRLAYARNFFGSLEDMARYFDDSKDEYYRISTGPNKESEAKGSSDQTINSDADIEMQDVSTKPHSADGFVSKEVYRGYRISSGESISPGTRIAMLKNLLKTTMHKFQCRDHEPMPQPREKLVVRGVKIQSIQYQSCVARTPQDMKLARARQVEGPLMAVLARDDLRFKERKGLNTPDKIPFVGERFDLFKEIGCMLILAAQRARARQEIPSNDRQQWWVSKPRWGGGPTKWGQLASEIFEDEDPSWSPEERRLQEEKRQQQVESRSKGIETKIDPKTLEVEDLIANNNSIDTPKKTAFPGIPAGATSVASPVVPTDLDIRPKKKKLRSMERPPNDEAVVKDGRRVMYIPQFRKKWYQDWQKLRPNTPTIDEKIISMRIGSQGEEFDRIFMLTSVNHHVALVKMDVHPDYLAWLASGIMVSDDEVKGLKKNVLYVSRSKWFDMFKVDERKDFLIGLWGVFSWLNRDYLPKEELAQMP